MMLDLVVSRLRVLKHWGFLARKTSSQAFAMCRRHMAPDRRKLATQVASHMSVVSSPRAQAQPEAVWGVMLVRNEDEVLPRQLTHCAAQGFQGLVIANNLSTDRTSALLRSYAGPLDLVLVEDREPGHFQAEKTDRLARIARRCGADWVVPMDADEFWFGATGTVAQELRLSANKVETALVHVVVRDTASGDFRVAAEPDRLQKVAFKSHRWAHMRVGNHGVDRVGRVGHSLRVMHWAYRSPEHLIRKVRDGSRALDLIGPRDPQGGHSWRDLALLTDSELVHVYDEMLQGRGPWFMDWVPQGEMKTVVPFPPAEWTPLTEVRP